MVEQSKPIIRTIRFYRIADWNDVKDNLPGEIQRLMNLTWSESGRYLFDAASDNRLALWPESVDYPLKLSFGRTRLTQLPTREKGGKLRPLQLAADEGLVEICHIIIYESGYSVVEYNKDGPRISALGPYLTSKTNLSSPVKFLPLFQQDILKVVREMPIIRMLELKGTPDGAATLADADTDLGKVYDSCVKLGARETVGLELRATSTDSESGLKQLALRLAKFFHTKPAASSHQGLKYVTVTGAQSNGRLQEIDLLDEHLIAKRAIERATETGKAVSAESAFEQLDDAYNEKVDELANAVVGRVFSL